MGITPISNLSPLPLARSEPELEPLPMARVENSARTGDETYSPSGGKSAGGSEDGTDEEFEDTAEETEAESGAAPAERKDSRQISFFA
ncbi:MAG: hypothetical protein ABR956_00765 [Terracidiphilus sp.]|jgi:hypothetical protein